MSKTDKICRRSINFITISKPINNLSPVYFILLGFYPFDREMDDIHYRIPFPPANSHEYNLLPICPLKLNYNRTSFILISCSNYGSVVGLETHCTTNQCRETLRFTNLCPLSFAFGCHPIWIALTEVLCNFSWQLLNDD